MWGQVGRSFLNRQSMCCSHFVSPKITKPHLQSPSTPVFAAPPPAPPALLPVRGLAFRSSATAAPAAPPHQLFTRGTFARMGKFACYVVIRGRRPGVYSTWDECKAQVNSYRDALYWGCHSEEEAIEALTTTPRVKTPPIRDTDTVISMLRRPSNVQEPPYSSVSLPPPSQSVASIDEWKFEKRLVGILLIALITLVVVVIAVVVKLYLL